MIVSFSLWLLLELYFADIHGNDTRGCAGYGSALVDNK